MQEIETMAGLGAIGVRLYGRTKLLLKLGKSGEYGLLEELTRNAILITYGRYIVRAGSRS